MNNKMLLKLEKYGTITIQLWPDLAPKAIARMKEIAAMGKYNNRPVERFEPNFVFQPLFYDGRDPEIDVMVEPEFNTVAENHALKFKRGTVAMAGGKDAASGSQYFITLQPVERLNGNFTVVGEVTDGWDVIEKIEALPVAELIDEESGHKYHQPAQPLMVEAVVID